MINKYESNFNANLPTRWIYRLSDLRAMSISMIQTFDILKKPRASNERLRRKMRTAAS